MHVQLAFAGAPTGLARFAAARAVDSAGLQARLASGLTSRTSDGRTSTAQPLTGATTRDTSRATPGAAVDKSVASTTVALGNAQADPLVYQPRSGVQRSDELPVWAGPQDNELGRLMLADSGAQAHTLADRWHGLGGALLRQLASTGEGYSQTLAWTAAPETDTSSDATRPTDELGGTSDVSASDTRAATPPEAMSAEDAAKLNDAALKQVADGAVKVKLTLTTQAGQRVDLVIAVNDGQDGGTKGLQLQVKSSGELSQGERESLAAMADGLDQALDGLGRDDPEVQLSRLKEFMSDGTLANLELSIDNPRAEVSGKALKSFQLSWDADKVALSMERGQSKMALSVATGAAGQVNGAQRQSAIDQMLAQIDAAGQRGHEDREWVGLFKQAFAQLQAAPWAGRADEPADVDETNHRAALTTAATTSVASQDSEVNSTGDAQPAKAQLPQSGLADFEARFWGETRKTNRFGGLVEQGTVDYSIGQRTTSSRKGSTGEQTITQQRTETLDATIAKTRTLLLDVESGNYDALGIKDRKTETTLIDMMQGAVKGALRKTDEHQMTTRASLERDRVTSRSDTPRDLQFIQRLI
ncbi:hypothetical protein AACH06_25025 [Ideonella sp. DXS29W]|uniref:Flagellar hook-length control protein FliK n=1 Tax=Ideonella lacteola TaxID=2984193 RepID=A0ABU9BW52_9BURK